MKALLQRVSTASVSVDQGLVGNIKFGFVVLLGVGHEDSQSDIDYLVNKIVNLRVFEDSSNKMNLSLKDVGGQVLAISQFTLFADCRKGRRPSFAKAAPPEMANNLYEQFVQKLKEQDITVATGVFQSYMQVEIHNDGPVTIMLDSKE
jgi:D-tyrosyl-tRNA(Tyr) deacylase